MSRLGSRPNVVIVLVFQRGKAGVGVGINHMKRHVTN